MYHKVLKSKYNNRCSADARQDTRSNNVFVVIRYYNTLRSFSNIFIKINHPQYNIYYREVSRVTIIVVCGLSLRGRVVKRELMRRRRRLRRRRALMRMDQ